MKLKSILFILFFSCGLVSHAQETSNTLTKKEEKQGWKLLFNGSNLDGWTSVGKDIPPASGWQVENGVLSTVKTEGHGGGDIITKEEFTDFELSLDFKISKGGNSGIKYFFTRYAAGGWLGLEYQILDNTNHPDAKMGRDGNRLQATLYDMFPLEKEQPNLIEEWNHARVVAKGSTVTHYLNGKKVLSFDRNSDQYRDTWQKSKFKDSNPPFGHVEKGHILLQEHGDLVSFRNIKIRPL